MRLLTGFVSPSEGEVRVLGKCISKWQLPQLRKRIGYLPQSLDTPPGAPLSAMDVVMMGRTGKRGLLHRLREEDYEMARCCAAELRIENLINRPLGSLSGGERQLVHLARALAQEPEILVLDEPTGNLDPRAAAMIIDTLDRLHKDHRLTVLVVTHEIESLPPACSSLILLKNGSLLASGAKRELLVPETLSELYNFPLSVEEKAGYYYLYRHDHRN